MRRLALVLVGVSGLEWSKAKRKSRKPNVGQANASGRLLGPTQERRAQIVPRHRNQTDGLVGSRCFYLINGEDST